MSIPDDRFFIIAGIVGLALLLLAVGLIAAVRGRNKPTIDESPIDSTPAPSWVKNIAGAAGKTLTGTASAVNAPAEALVVLRDAVSNAWVVEVNGLRYQSLKDIHDDKAANKVLAAIEGLRQFAGITIAAAPAPDQSADAVPVPIVPAGESIPFVPPDSLPRLEPVIVSALAQGTTTVSKPKYPAPAGSILDQIEKVLQRSLLKEPDLTARRIHIGAATDGSLLIEVDWSQYKTAEEVPETRVRNLIKAAIQEWERTA
ncbi:MAG: hypothetical protein HY870_17930 [Chloroflexi bacterium]|nr:hypothetical protein [Chloroflexota bacterium]